MRVCIYSPVSTSRLDIENQSMVLMELAKQRDWEIMFDTVRRTLIDTRSS